jgi:ribose 5-phosphate isomerase A
MSVEVEALKRAAARRAVELVTDGMVLGLGTGSTAAQAVIALAERVAAGLRVIGVPSSRATEELARQVGMPLTTLVDQPALDLTIDGADEVDPALNLIKGAGGALLREKVLASASRQFAIVVDDSKLVSRLGQRSALPVEVVPFALPVVVRRLDELGLRPTPRRRGEMLALTDNGNAIVDCQTGPLADPLGLATRLRTMPGVVDHGLFLGMATIVVVAHTSGAVTLHRPADPPAW